MVERNFDSAVKRSDSMDTWNVLHKALNLLGIRPVCESHDYGEISEVHSDLLNDSFVPTQPSPGW